MAEKLIYIADNHELSREGIISFVNRYFNGEAKIELMVYREDIFNKLDRNPFLIIIDHSTFEWNSPNDYVLLRKASPETAILVISDVFTYTQAKDILNAGVLHFIMKSSAGEDFFNAFKSIVNKKKFISSEIYDILISKEQKPATSQALPLRLSPAEIEVARLIADGKTTKEIATFKHLSFHTVNTHRKNIFRKLGINTSFELVKYVMNSGLSTDIEYHI